MESEKHKKGKMKDSKGKRKNIFVRGYLCLKKKAKFYVREFRKITWCPWKKWLSNSFAVLLLGTAMAVMLTGFDTFAQAVIELIGGLLA